MRFYWGCSINEKPYFTPLNGVMALKKAILNLYL